MYILEKYWHTHTNHYVPLYSINILCSLSHITWFFSVEKLRYIHTYTIFLHFHTQFLSSQENEKRIREREKQVQWVKAGRKEGHRLVIIFFWLSWILNWTKSKATKANNIAFYSLLYIQLQRCGGSGNMEHLTRDSLKSTSSSVPLSLSYKLTLLSRQQRK